MKNVILLKNKRNILVIIIMITLCSCSQSTKLELVSPNGLLTVKLDNSENKLTYNLFDNGTEIIVNSEISILQNSDVEVVKTKQNEINESWKPVWGQFREINNHYNELEVSLNYNGVPATLFIRSYNNGVAFRFKVSELPKKSTSSFFIEYGLSNTTQLYSPAGEGKPLGACSCRKFRSINA